MISTHAIASLGRALDAAFSDPPDGHDGVCGVGDVVANISFAEFHEAFFEEGEKDFGDGNVLVVPENVRPYIDGPSPDREGYTRFSCEQGHPFFRKESGTWMNKFLNIAGETFHALPKVDFIDVENRFEFFVLGIAPYGLEKTVPVQW